MADGISSRKLGDSLVVRLCQADVIQAIEQAMLVERVDLEGVAGLIRPGQCLRFKINRDFGTWSIAQLLAQRRAILFR